MSKNVIKDSMLYLPSKLFPALLGLMTAPIYTRLLTIKQFGQYQILLVTLTIISSFFISWIPSIIIRFSYTVNLNILKNYTKMLLIWSIFFASITWVITLYLNQYKIDIFNISFGIIWLFVFSKFEYYSAYLRSANLSKIYTNVNISKSIFSLLIGICLYSLFALEEWSFILGQALVMGIILIYLSSYVNKNTDLYWPSKSDEFDKENIKIFGFYAALINIFTILLSGADRFIIKYFLGDEMVAIYSANYDLAEKSIFFINSLLILSSSSTVIKLFDISGEKMAVEYLSKLLRYYLIIAPAILVGVSIIYPRLNNLIFPSNYFYGVAVFPLVGLGGVFIGILHRYSIILNLHKRNDLILYAGLIAFISNFLFGMFFIPIYGIYGAAISTSIANFLWLSLTIFFSSNYIVPKFPFNTLLKIIIVILTVGFLFFNLVQHFGDISIVFLVILFIVYVVLYLIGLFLIGVISKEDINISI